MARKSFIAGNWKMNGLQEDSKDKISFLKEKLLDINTDNVDVVICPPFTILSQLLEVAQSSEIKIGAQDCHFNENGAHTGDISPVMLKDLGCDYVILGHSERRTNHNESNEIVKQKVESAIKNSLYPIVCIGETKEEKEQDKTLDVVLEQLKKSLPNEIDSKIVIAYEPVWAIGTGLVPTMEDIAKVHSYIREILGQLSSKETADKIRILYGGSLNAKNCGEILQIKDVDGGLIGGASLIPEDFLTIIKNANKI